MQMAEHLQRHPSRDPRHDPREHDLAHFGEERHADPRGAIRKQQPNRQHQECGIRFDIQRIDQFFQHHRYGETRHLADHHQRQREQNTADERAQIGQDFTQDLRFAARIDRSCERHRLLRLRIGSGDGGWIHRVMMGPAALDSKPHRRSMDLLSSMFSHERSGQVLCTKYAGMIHCGMAVYVDNAVFQWRGRRWAHLLADDLDALHAFAARLCIPRRAFQDKRSGAHYDVDSALREVALRLGAIPISRLQDRERMRAIIADARRQWSGVVIGAIDPADATDDADHAS